VTVGFILAVGLVPVGSFVALALAWLATLVVAGAAQLGVFRAARGSVIALPFILAALPLVFTRPEDPIGQYQVGPLTLTVSGLGLAMFATIAAKSWISVQAALLLAMATPFHELMDGLRAMRLPPIMVSIIGFMYRYLAVLGEEARRLMRARDARSADPAGGGGGTIRWRATVTGRMAGTLFLRSYERSERIYAAMQARGFEGELRHMHAHTLSRNEIAAGIATAIGLGLFVVAANAGGVIR
jgi:cobalt/nickel transport system permease protein